MPSRPQSTPTEERKEKIKEANMDQSHTTIYHFNFKHALYKEPVIYDLCSAVSAGVRGEAGQVAG